MYGGSNNAGGNVAPYLSVMEQLNVLLVENDPACLFETAKMLQMCAYKVTLVDIASSAISMLSNQNNVKTDVIMASTNSPDGQGFKLLQLAVAMGIPVVLLSVDEDPFFTNKAIQDGAFLIIPKPIRMETLKLLWQLIMREKMHKIATNQQREINTAATGNNVVNADLTNHMDDDQLEPTYGGGSTLNNNVLPIDNNNNGRQIEGGMNYVVEYYGDENQRVRRKKSCTEWTDELHAKFVNAVLTLGDGRCFPKEIMLLMNVPGLTRMQVASHLQKCRNENWRTPEERKNRLANQSENPPLPIKARRRFGSMPNVCRSSSSNARLTNGGSSSQHNPHEPAGLVQNMIMGSTEPIMNLDAINNHHNVVNYGLVIPHAHQQQNHHTLPDGPAGLVQNGVGSTEPMNLDVVNNHHNLVNYGPAVPHTYQQQNPTIPDGPSGLIQDVAGSTEPMNMDVANNNFVNYGSVVPHHVQNQQIDLLEINNNVVDYNGAGTDDQYLSNLADDFTLNFGDIDSFFNNDNYVSLPLDLSGGFNSHVPGADNMGATAGYEQQDPFYGNHQQNDAYNNNPAGNYAQWNNGANFGSGANAS